MAKKGGPMHLIDFALTADLAVAGIAATAVIGLLAFPNPDFMVVRISAWICALAFGSTGILWAVTSGDSSLAIKMSVAAVFAGAAAAALIWLLNDVGTTERRAEAIQQTSPPAKEQKSAHPNSDVPKPMFQLGGAKNTTVRGNKVYGPVQDREVFNIQGHDEIFFERNEINVPAPQPHPTRFEKFKPHSNSQLKLHTATFARELTEADRQHKLDPRRLEYDALSKKIREDLGTRYLGPARDLQDEICGRLLEAGIAVVQFDERPIDRLFRLRSGFRVVQDELMAGPQPLVDVATYLEFLAGKLPE